MGKMKQPNLIQRMKTIKQTYQQVNFRMWNNYSFNYNA